MKTINKLILFFACIALIACEKNDEIITDDSTKLFGHWINPVPADTLWTFEKSDSLIDYQYGFSFIPGQLFVERNIAGWCATPPVSYADFDGTWTMKDSILHITVGYWGGMSKYQWKIISLDNSSLTIHRIKEEYIYKD